MPENQNEPTFGHEVVNEALNKAVYLPAYAVSKKVGMSSYILSKLTSSLHVVYRSTDRRVNLGLNLKFEVKKQKVLGYTRKTDSGWEYSEKAVGLLQAYKQLFPDFIAGLEKNQRQDIYIAEEMYPQGDSVGSIKKIEEWLKKSKIKELERVDLEAMQLDKVMRIFLVLGSWFLVLGSWFIMRKQFRCNHCMLTSCVIPYVI